MKETYVSPALFFESFSLSQTIARNCGDTHTGTLGESNHYNEYSCEWDLGGFTLFFLSDGDRCDDGPEDAEEEYEVEALCYNNPDGGKTIFSST